MEEIFVFLTEYTEFLEKMEVTQQEKLDLLLSGELKKIEQSIMVQQAMDKQLENLEQARMRLFQEHGVEGKTFRELIPLQPEIRNGESSSSCRQDWQLLYDRLQKAIDNIRYYNKKSQDFARSELIKAGSDAGTVDPSSGVYHPDYGGRKNMFSKKI